MRNISRSILRIFKGRKTAILARCKDLRDDAGSAMVELALILSFLLGPLLLGTSDMATVFYGSIEIANAAHAGAMYGMTSSTYASDTSEIKTAAQTEASDFGSNLTVTPTVYYACSSALSGTQYSTQSAATSACTGTGNHPLEFVQVVASAPVTPPTHFPGLPATVTLSSTSIMEVEE